MPNPTLLRPSIAAVCALALAACSAHPRPERMRGVSVHLVPERSASWTGSSKGGFVASLAEPARLDTKQRRFASAALLIEFVKRQSADRRANGVWLVVTHPDAYSAMERAQVELLASGCQGLGIPLFVCRGRDLPSGWQQVEPAR